MLLRDLKKEIFLPKDEIFINKTVNIRGIEVDLISITSEEGKNVLWAMYEKSSISNDELALKERKVNITERDKLISGIINKKDKTNIHLSELIIQKQVMKFTSSSGINLCYMSNKQYTQLKHFIDKGLDISKWAEVDIDNIVIVSFEQEKGGVFPKIDYSKALDITLKIISDCKQVLINQPMNLKFGKSDSSKKMFFYDSINNTNRFFYINKVYQYDIWEHYEKVFEKANIHGLSKEEIENAKEGAFNSLQNICPKGKNMTIIEYEAENNIQLDFYSKEYLDKRIVQEVSNNKERAWYEPEVTSSASIIMSSEREYGDNGYLSRVCVIKPIDKNSNKSIEVELFSWYMEIEEEIMKIK